MTNERNQLHVSFEVHSIIAWRSKAFEKSSNTRAVAISSSEAVIMSSVTLNRAVSVPWLLLNPDCLVGSMPFNSTYLVSCLLTTFSRIFDITGRILIGLRSLCSFTSTSLGNGTTLASFQLLGKVFVEIEVLMIKVIIGRVAGNVSRIIAIDTLSCPHAWVFTPLIVLRICASVHAESSNLEVPNLSHLNCCKMSVLVVASPGVFETFWNFSTSVI